MTKTEERTKFKDKVLLSISTPFEIKEIPYATPPSEKVFDVKDYAGREWTMIFMEKKLYNQIEELCRKRGLDPKKVLYGTILKLIKMLK